MRLKGSMKSLEKSHAPLIDVVRRKRKKRRYSACSQGFTGSREGLRGFEVARNPGLKPGFGFRAQVLREALNLGLNLGFTSGLTPGLNPGSTQVCSAGSEPRFEPRFAPRFASGFVPRFGTQV